MSEQENNNNNHVNNENILDLIQRGYRFVRTINKDEQSELILVESCQNENQQYIVRIIDCNKYNMKDLIEYLNSFNKNYPSNYFADIQQTFINENQNYYYIRSLAYDFSLSSFVEFKNQNSQNGGDDHVENKVSHNDNQNNNKITFNQVQDITLQLLNIIENLIHNNIYNYNLTIQNIGYYSKYNSFLLIDYNINQFLNNNLNQQQQTIEIEQEQQQQSVDTLNLDEQKLNEKNNALKYYINQIGSILVKIIIQGTQINENQFKEMNDNLFDQLSQQNDNNNNNPYYYPKQFIQNIIFKIIQNNFNEEDTISKLIEQLQEQFPQPYSTDILYENMLKSKEQINDLITLNAYSIRSMDKKQSCEHLKLILEGEVQINDLEYIKEQLNHYNQLKTLIIETNLLIKNDEEIQHMRDTFYHVTHKIISLKLNLWDKNITPEGTQKLSEFLQQCKNLKNLSIDFGANKFSDDGINNISRSLKYCLNLTQLTLEVLGCEITNEGTKELGQSLQKLINLRQFKIVLWANNINNEGGQYITEGLINCYQLTDLYLDIGQNSIEQSALVKIIQPLQQLPLIKFKFILWNNQLGEGISVIGNELKQLIHLKELILEVGGNQINDQAISILADDIKQLPNLLKFEFNLWINEITDVGAKYLCKSLTQANLLNNININIASNQLNHLYSNQLAHIFYKAKKIINVFIKTRD